MMPTATALPTYPGEQARADARDEWLAAALRQIGLDGRTAVISGGFPSSTSHLSANRKLISVGSGKSERGCQGPLSPDKRTNRDGEPPTVKAPRHFPPPRPRYQYNNPYSQFF